MVYEAVENQLFWLEQGPRSAQAELQVFSCPESETELETGSNLLLGLPEDVLPLADFFRGEASEVLERWSQRSEKESAARRISVEALTADGEIGLPAFGAVGQVMKFDPAAGYIALARSPSHTFTDLGGRIHARAHFFDHGEDHSSVAHWFGITSRLGSASVGLAFGIDGCYSVLLGDVPDGRSGKYYGWLRMNDRSRGWHCWELVFDDGEVNVIMDGEPVVTAEAQGAVSEDEPEEVWLVSRSGGFGFWAGVELFHTPAGNKSWETGVQCFDAEDYVPWQGNVHTGRWQMDDEGIMKSISFDEGSVARVTPVKQKLLDAFAKCCDPSKYEYKSGMDDMLGKEFKVLTVNEDGMVGLPSPDKSDDGIWWFPPYAPAIAVVERPIPSPPLEPPPVEEAPAPFEPERLPSGMSEVVEEAAEIDAPPPPPPPPGIGSLMLECWSIPGEEDVARIERCVQTFVNALQAADVAMPENVRRIQKCSSEHPGCFVYNFGTRRVHMATRNVEGGRLMLVVRCGGGYMDFIEFARRHGSLEQLRVQKKAEQGGREVVRVTSVLSKGRVKAVPGTSRASSRGPMAQSSSRPPSRAAARARGGSEASSRTPSRGLSASRAPGAA
eukprot:TRINITY_DN42902_c0_g1_i1.p1 TRINITY_DN42902_c0_g1~~TRINITY_DN42902_c0_g1_i1.p1  ORF type:complete len:701 (+),score=116.98 TRINITY_DN42902_c0_g1_i1:266-2104(+)